MKKIWLRLFCYLLILQICLTGCSKNKQSAGAFDESEEKTISENTQTVDEGDSNRHVSIRFSEKFFVDAEVANIQTRSCNSAVIDPIFNPPERTASVLFPNDKSEFIVDDEYDGHDSYKLITSDGNAIYAHRGYLLYYRDEKNKRTYQEIIDLLSRRPAETTAYENSAMDFMSPEDAIELGKNTIADLGVSFEPIVNSIVALDHNEIMEWQKECISKDDYNEFGDIHILPMLTDDYDSYYITFTFAYNGIPVYGREDEANIVLANSMFPPSKASAELLITPHGVQYLAVIEGYSYNKQYENRTIITQEDAINVLKEKYDLIILTESLRVSRIWLEYIPRYTDQAVEITPYWCFGIDFQIKNADTGEMFWSTNRLVERFNAFTGEDITYGG